MMKPMYTPPIGRFGTAIRSAVPSIPEAEPLFNIGDTVMHPSEGVCDITELRRMDLCGALRTYYTLKPSADKSSSTVYLPVARGNAILRRLLSRQEIMDIIHRSAAIESLWIDDSKQRKEAFTRILTEGDYTRMIRMMKEIREQRILREQGGRKACAADEAILAEAERLVHQEFSHVMHISPEETAAFIRRELHLE